MEKLTYKRTVRRLQAESNEAYEAAQEAIAEAK